MATVAETKHKAGRILGIVKQPESLRSEHDTILTEAYDAVYAQLKEEALAIWSSAGTVPNRVMEHVAALMAFNVADDLGVPNARYQRILARRNVALPNIRKFVTPTHESLEDPEDF